MNMLYCSEVPGKRNKKEPGQHNQHNQHNQPHRGVATMAITNHVLPTPMAHGMVFCPASPTNSKNKKPTAEEALVEVKNMLMKKANITQTLAQSTMHNHINNMSCLRKYFKPTKAPKL